ncbi:hypothetical protein BDZ45DRAFT_723078 [Acephala macrosclerotiorum]|nr:hypothetical protein BDZ45DRAFT_723078 [Acephala macrosclerotiorum]
MSPLEKLPPEIREMIWNNCLLSPTGYLELIDPNPTYRTDSFSDFLVMFSQSPVIPIDKLDPPFPASRRKKKDKQSKWHLKISTPASVSSPSDRPFLIQLDDLDLTSDRYITTSLLRVNKMVHAEAELIFWGKNTFLFSDAQKVQDFRNKAGYVAFGRMISINIVMNLRSFRDKDFPSETLLKSLADWNEATNSISNSSVKKFKLSMSKYLLDMIWEWRFGLSWMQNAEEYRKVIGGLREGKLLDEKGIEGGIEVFWTTASTGRGPRGTSEKYGVVLDELYAAFGGKVVWEGKVWENGTLVSGFEKENQGSKAPHQTV